jgi:hypothetical protein
MRRLVEYSSHWLEMWINIFRLVAFSEPAFDGGQLRQAVSAPSLLFQK